MCLENNSKRWDVLVCGYRCYRVIRSRIIWADTGIIGEIGVRWQFNLGKYVYTCTTLWAHCNSCTHAASQVVGLYSLYCWLPCPVAVSEKASWKREWWVDLLILRWEWQVRYLMIYEKLAMPRFLHAWSMTILLGQTFVIIISKYTETGGFQFTGQCMHLVVWLLDLNLSNTCNNSGIPPNV